jgi:hypothetical protein
MKKYLYTILLVFVLTFLASSICFAATIKFNLANSPVVGINSKLRVVMTIDTLEKSVNAIEGKFVFPGNLLELQQINDGNSIINFWIKKPELSKNGEVYFSGIIPRGYVGERGVIVGLDFIAKNQGYGEFSANNFKVMENDGLATEIATTEVPLGIYIENKFSIGPAEKEKENEGPEKFTPIISKNKNIFDNKYFLIFDTKDKDSGISHYEVKEGDRNYISVESPYVLNDKSLTSNIYVKAIDKMGNETISYLPPQNYKIGYKIKPMYIISILLLIFLLLSYLLWKKQKTKRKS